MFAERMERLRVRLAEAEEDVVLITDDDSVYYFTGFYDYLYAAQVAMAMITA